MFCPKCKKDTVTASLRYYDGYCGQRVGIDFTCYNWEIECAYQLPPDEVITAESFESLIIKILEPELQKILDKHKESSNEGS